MSATFTWVIEWMKCVPQDGQYTDVVVTAGWRCNGSQTANATTYENSACGTASFQLPAQGEAGFTPYNQLTESQVLGWCWANGVDKDSTEAYVQSLLTNQIDPPVVETPLPWITPAA